MKRIIVLFIAIFICNVVIAQEKQDTITSGYRFEYSEKYKKFSFYNIADYEKANELKKDLSSKYDDKTVKFQKNIAEIYCNLAYSIFKDSPYFETVKDSIFTVEIYLNTEGEIISLIFNLYFTKTELEDIGYDRFIELYERFKNEYKYPPYNMKNKKQKKYTNFRAVFIAKKSEVDEK